MIEIKTYNFDWYSKLRINKTVSTLAGECWAGNNIENKEYAFKFRQEEFNEEKLIEFLIRVEKDAVLFADSDLPLYFDEISYGQGEQVKDFSFLGFFQREGYVAFNDAEIIKRTDRIGNHSIIFQQRIPWILSINPNDRDKVGYFIIYGRFATAII